MSLNDDARNAWIRSSRPWIKHVDDGKEPNRGMLFPKIAEILRKREARRILDAGCGEGSLARYLSERARAEGRAVTIVGVDFCDDLIAHAQRIEKQGDASRPRDITYVPADLTRLAEVPAPQADHFATGRYDAIVCNLVLQGARDLLQILLEFRRLLKPDGVVLITIHDPDHVTPDDDTFDRWQLVKDASVTDPERCYRVTIDKCSVMYFHRPAELYDRAPYLAGFKVSSREPYTGVTGGNPNRAIPTFLMFQLEPSRRTRQGHAWERISVAAAIRKFGSYPRTAATLATLKPFIPDDAQLQEHTLAALQPIVSARHPSGDLYLLLEGNAFLIAPVDTTDNLMDLLQLNHRGTLPMHGALHPLVLCPGDLIGEFEVLGGQPYSTTILAGLPWQSSLKGAKTLEGMGCRVLRIPSTILAAKPPEKEQDFRHTVYSYIEQKMRSVVQLLAALRQSGPRDRMQYLLWVALRGDLPVVKYTTATGAVSGDLRVGETLCLPLREHHAHIDSVSFHSKYLEILLDATDATVKDATAWLAHHDYVEKTYERPSMRSHDGGSRPNYGAPSTYTFRVTPEVRNRLWRPIVRKSQTR